ncbi:MAG: cation-transporting P-type ATPase [Candidatus Absconditabacterales bacterium]
MAEIKGQYYKMSPEAALADLQTSFEGLKKEDIPTREKIYGRNMLVGLKKDSFFLKFLRQFKDIFIILLIISDIISLYLQDFRGVAILTFIILINAIIGYVQEAKAERIMESLKKMLHPNAKVKRNGVMIEILGEEIMPGDMVYVEEGDSIPADMRLIQESEFQTNDFSLTGESNPQNKFTHEIAGDVLLSERNNCVWMGTTVATGYAWCVVFATGMNTELGRIANLSQEQIPEETPLQTEMKNIAKKLTFGTLILAVILVIVALLAHFTPREAFIFVIGISASMIPQGLPAQVSIALSLAAGRLAKNKALVKQLASVETLGCVNVICTDKTGTLTKNEMTVKHMWLGFNTYDVEGDGYEPIGNILDPLTHHPIDTKFTTIRNHFFNTLFLASNAKINPPDDEHQTRYAIGDPTEAALISLAQKAAYNTERLGQLHTQLHQYGFDSVRKRMSSVRVIDDKKYLYVKGSSTSVLEKCTQIYDGKKVRKITQEDKIQIEKYIKENANNAMRNLTFAYKPLDNYDASSKWQDMEHDLIFLGCTSVIDPPRDEVHDAVISANEAKIKIIMITGDYGLTAEAIAKRIGLEDGEKLIMVAGEQLNTISDIQLAQILSKPVPIIFSRTSPEDKLRIVNLLRKTHNIIAVTGDGINDAPALRAANIGVAMGKIGTDVAKNASEIVLLDDSFHTLVYAIKEGRIIFENLKKTIISCITSNGGELFTVLPSLAMRAIFGLPMAINPFQILAVDMIGEMGPLTALARDPAQKDLMKEKPRNVANHIINKPIIIDLIRSGALMGGIAFTNYLLYIIFHGYTLSSFTSESSIYTTATSITYTSILFCQFMNIFSRRAGMKSVFTSYLRSNKKLLFAFGFSLMCIMILIYTPVIHTYFAFGKMDIQDRLFPILGGIVFLLIRESAKYFQRRKFQKNETEVIETIQTEIK